MKYIKTKSDYQDKVQHSCYTPTVIADALKEHNIQLTRQRKDVITEMCRLRKVEDAETLWMHLIRDRKISVAAVYTTLKILIRYGIVSKRMDDTRKASYQMTCLQNGV